VPKNKHLRFLLYVIYAALVYFIVVKLLPQVIILILPFILAYFIATMTNPIVKLLNTKLKFPKLLASSTALIIVLGSITTVITLVINRILFELKQFTDQVPSLIQELPQRAEQINLQWLELTGKLSPQMATYLNNLLLNLSSTLYSLVQKMAQSTLNIAGNIASLLPSIILFTVAFILSCIFMTNDFDMIKRSIARQIPNSMAKKVHLIKTYSGIAVGKYLRGMGIILCITFTELIIGFSIINVQYAFILAIVIAFVDILPVLGSGSILLPWCVISLWSGDMKFASSLFIIYLIVTVARQILEPKVMSSSLGTYPLVTLLGMYIGLQLFGFIGMILAPITVLVLLYLQNAKVIFFWKMED